MQKLLFLLLIPFNLNLTFGQNSIVISKIDSLLAAKSNKPFNGVVLISQNEKIIYSKAIGFSDLEQKLPIDIEDEFVIGSISKQITAVLILQEYEKGNIKLDVPIRNYLPELPEKWADSITIHQLLTHTHGIIAIDKPLIFSPGSQFQYSQIGYELLSNILESVTKKSFSDISSDLFNNFKLNNSFNPKQKGYNRLVKGYTEQSNGEITYETKSFENYVAAGTFISNASDLVKWNNLLHEGKLIKKETLELMTKRYATRQHPIFGEIEYGYGLTFKKDEEKIQVGATGFAPGFVSANFYFPITKTSVVVLQNIARDFPDLKKIFYFNTEILNIAKQIK